MNLSNGADPTAILEAERKDVLLIDMSGTLVLSRNCSAISIEHSTPRFHLANTHFVLDRRATNRVQRFWTFAKAAWRFSK